MAIDLAQYGKSIAQPGVAREISGSTGIEQVGQSLENAAAVLYQKDAEERELQKRQRYGVIEAEYGAELAKTKAKHLEDLRTGKISADDAGKIYDERVKAVSDNLTSRLAPDDAKYLSPLFQQKQIVNRIEYDAGERQYRGERAIADFNKTKEAMQIEGLTDPSKIDLLAAKLENAGAALKPYLGADDYQRAVSGAVNDLGYEVLVTNINASDNPKQLKELREKLASGKEFTYLTEKRAPLMNAIDTQLREIKRAELEAQNRMEAELVGTITGMKNTLSDPTIRVDPVAINQIEQTASALLQSGKPSKRAQGAELRVMSQSYQDAQKLMAMPIAAQRQSISSIKGAGLTGDVEDTAAQMQRIQYLERTVIANENAAKSDPLLYSAKRQGRDLPPIDVLSGNIASQILPRQEAAAASSYWTGQQAGLLTKGEAEQLVDVWNQIPSGEIIKELRGLTAAGLGKRPEIQKTLSMLKSGGVDYSKAAIAMANERVVYNRDVGELMITGNKALSAKTFKMDPKVTSAMSEKVVQRLGAGIKGSAGNQAYGEAMEVVKQVYTALSMEAGEVESIDSPDDDRLTMAMDMALGKSAEVNGAGVLMPVTIDDPDEFEIKAKAAIRELLYDKNLAPNMMDGERENAINTYQLMPDDLNAGTYVLVKPDGYVWRPKGRQAMVKIQ